MENFTQTQCEESNLTKELLNGERVIRVRDKFGNYYEFIDKVSQPDADDETIKNNAYNYLKTNVKFKGEQNETKETPVKL